MTKVTQEVVVLATQRSFKRGPLESLGYGTGIFCRRSSTNDRRENWLPTLLNFSFPVVQPSILPLPDAAAEFKKFQDSGPFAFLQKLRCETEIRPDALQV